jgi:hypothetical protein
MAAGGAATTLDTALGLLESNESPIMLGDIAPPSMIRAFQIPALGPPPPPTPPLPPTAPRPPTGPAVNALNARRFVRAVVPSVGGFKISDNQSPRPQDRVFFNFNYYNDLNYAVNRALGGGITGMQAYRENFGFEKTFWDRNASIGMRFPIETLSVATPIKPLGGTSTAVGNLSIFGKYVLWQDAQRKNLVSTGLMVTTPNGPTSFAGSRATLGFRDTNIQPFLGFYYGEGNFYAQGFSSVSIATDRNDLTLYYNDLGIGYYLYRSALPSQLVQAVIPTFEVHVNTPLNHRGALKLSDPAGVPDVVDLTYGANIMLGRGTLFSTGFTTPVTGPRPFAFEYMAVLNIYFGPTRRAGMRAMTPPVF